MSDNWIGIIPRDPLFVPSETATEQAEAFLAEIAPESEEITSGASETIQFRDCGGNLESICCPICKTEVPIDWWHEQMGDDDLWEDGFNLEPIHLPCGHVAESLNDLQYDFDQGFSRFILDAMNPNVEALSSSQIMQFEEMLGCKVKVIYQHL